MKKHLYHSIILCGLTVVSALGQSPAPGVAPASAAIPAHAIKNAESSPSTSEAPKPPKLTKFNLDFPGGNPKQLVAAIEKATQRPLNVVIPDEFANESIPALRMSQVTVPDLFQAMEAASIKAEQYRSSYPGGAYQTRNTSISFRTSGQHSDDSIWSFRGREKLPDFTVWDTKPAPAKISRFYALTPYLEQGFKVEDITTAIQTGWKMLGEKETPNISFHKETKLLIAVGEPGKLETIDAVLSALKSASAASGSFNDRLQSIIQRAAPAQPAPLKPNAAAPQPAATPESEP